MEAQNEPISCRPRQHFRVFSGSPNAAFSRWPTRVCAPRAGYSIRIAFPFHPGLRRFTLAPITTESGPASAAEHTSKARDSSGARLA